ncbi:MAG: glycoside hydrolase, partial [candidate division Zixibacteria bacterium]|nr:glycoside hydrolase [candidate division Zixibacteria bacterium]
SFTYPDTVLGVSGYQYANGGVNTYSAPAADADITGGPFDGNIYMSFTNIGPEDTDRSDVDFVRSLDNGATWSERIQINDALESDLIDSFHPWLIVNQEGVIMVIFYDQRYDSPNYYLFDLMAAYSFDGGLTFTSNHRITTASSSPGDLKFDEENGPIIDPETGWLRPLSDSRAGLIGEYIGVTAYHDKTNAVWTDSRDGNSETYTANWYLPLLEPRLAAPELGSYPPSAPSFAWATSWKHDQDRYRLEISTDETFGVDVTSRTVDTNLYTLDISLDEGNYFWRVKSLKTTNADSSEYSAVWSFTLDTTPPDPPQLSEPADETVTLEPQPFFDWSDETKAGAPVTYSLYVSTDPAFTPGPNTVTYSGLTTSELALPNPLQPDILTYWKVEAIDGASNSSESVVFTVTNSSLACGDVDGDGGPDVTIADLVYMVDYMFNDGPPPPVMAAADVDGSGGDIDIADLVYMVDYMFNGGPAPICR